MTLWNVYAGTFTKEFAEIFQSLRTSSNDWERNWVGGGTATSQWKPDQNAYRDATYSEGIEHLVLDDSSGVLHHAGTLGSGVVNPQNVSVHPCRPVVYAPEYAPRGRLLAFEIGPDGSCTRHAAVDSFGRLAIAATVHPLGRFAYVAHFGDGTLTAVALDDDGLPITSKVVVSGDADPRAANFSRHHQVRVSPTGNAVIVTDVGRDELTVYRCDQLGIVEPRPAARIAFPAGSGPRHLEFDPSGRRVFVVSERRSSLFVLEADDGIPTRIVSEHSTVPAEFDGNNRPSELCLHPNGRWLYVGNRGFDSISVFSVGDHAKIEVISYESSRGRNLSSLQLDPTGRFLLAGNVIPGSVATFKIRDDGGLQVVGSPLEIAAPRSLTVCASSAVDGR